MESLTLRKRVGRLGASSLVLLALAVTGCGSGKGKVTGKVTCGGKPVVQGTVFVNVAKDNKQFSGVIQPDGTYTVDGVDVGEAVITVESPKPREVDPREAEMMKDKAMAKDPMGGGKDKSKEAEELAAKWVEIPPEYTDAAQKKITLKVEKGTNNFDIKIP